jgi:hypothetical protein
MTERTDTTTIWRDYQRGIDFLTKRDLYNRVDDSYAFAQGDQWHGLETGGERMPQLNFLRPTMKYGVAMVAQNGMSINYGSMDYSPNRQMSVELCEKLNEYAAQTWERIKLDKLSWDIIQRAYIAGDDFAYFYDDTTKGKHTIKMELLDNTNVLLADEQNEDIQSQPYILIAQRRYVADVKAEAKANGIPKADIDSIIPDDEDERQLTEVDEVENDLKCITVLKLYKQDGKVYIARSTKTVIYQKDTVIDGLSLYPIAKYSWNPQHGFARGTGDIYDKIPNQIEVNKALARLMIAAKEFSFPHIVYDGDKIADESVKDLAVIGSQIKINAGGVGKASDFVSYMQAANVNPLAKEIITDIITQTRDLAGAGDAVTGQVNPEKASGAAIIAVRDAAALPLNQQVAAYKQFVEDIAAIWIDMWRAYMVDGIDITIDDQPVHIPYEALQGIEVDIRIDVSPTNPYSKYAQEQGLTNLFTAQAITFEEFVEALDDDSSIPKQKLTEIIEKRMAMQQQQQANELQRYQVALQAMAEENTQLKQQTAQMPQYIEQATKAGMEKQATEDTRRQRLAELEAMAANAMKGGGDKSNADSATANVG